MKTALESLEIMRLNRYSETQWDLIRICHVKLLAHSIFVVRVCHFRVFESLKIEFKETRRMLHMKSK